MRWFQTLPYLLLEDLLSERLLYLPVHCCIKWAFVAVLMCAVRRLAKMVLAQITDAQCFHLFCALDGKCMLSINSRINFKSRINKNCVGGLLE